MTLSSRHSLTLRFSPGSHSAFPQSCSHLAISFKQLPLFSGLSDAQVSRLEQLGETVSLSAGGYVMREGEQSLDVFIILSGRAQVTKGAGNLRIGTLGPGAIIGEIALIERAARSASVQAIDDLQLFVLRESRFIDRPELADIYPILMRNVSRELCERVRKQSDTTVKSLVTQVSMARFIVNFLLMSSLYTLGLGILLRLKQPFASPTFLSLGSLVVFLAVLIRFMRKSGQPMSAYGLTLVGWRRSLRESLIASAAFMVFAVGVKLFVVYAFPSMAGKPLIDIEGSFTDYAVPFAWSSWWLYVVLYSLFSPVQASRARSSNFFRPAAKSRPPRTAGWRTSSRTAPLPPCTRTSRSALPSWLLCRACCGAGSTPASPRSSASRSRIF